MTSFFSDALAALNAPFNLANTTILAAKEAVMGFPAYAVEEITENPMYFAAGLATSVAVIAGAMMLKKKKAAAAVPAKKKAPAPAAAKSPKRPAKSPTRELRSRSPKGRK